ncbi:hypothetical protein ACMYQ1_09960 [Shewanella oncorhynchi]|uniref:hypothetical protein n=1 Tax=Shewanella oncorhynchi TaxID=2726434 RepID=UPI0039F11F1A
MAVSDDLSLRDKLNKFGVADDVAKEVVGEFAFDLAILHDQGEIRVNGKDYSPRIAFDNFSNALICTNEESNLHEYAFGSTSEAFGE